MWQSERLASPAVPPPAKAETATAAEMQLGPAAQLARPALQATAAGTACQPRRPVPAAIQAPEAAATDELQDSEAIQAAAHRAMSVSRAAAVPPAAPLQAKEVQPVNPAPEAAATGAPQDSEATQAAAHRAMSVS